MKTKVAILILSAFLIVEKGYIDLDRVGGCDGGLKKDAEASFWGPIQIRTGVNGFADRYLTTRPWNLVVSAKVAHLF